MDPPRAEPFRVEVDGRVLAGEEVGEGRPIVLVHGLTATRRYVVHGSNALLREGYRLISYDARGHGESDPAPPGGGYSYPELADDLQVVMTTRGIEDKPLLVGHSMGAQTIVTLALRRPDDFAGLVLAGPVSIGRPYREEVLAHWDALAEGLETNGVDGFMAAYATQSLDPTWRETVLRFTRERMGLHRHPVELAQALREVPRSHPFDGVDELTALDVPALVVASHDEADPGHPYKIAAAWAETLPQARLIGEKPGESPLAWQGGKLSREIAAFCEEPAVAERLRG